MTTSLQAFFDPKSVAIVGVSQDPKKLGYGLARNLINSDYQGAIHFVNPRGGMLFDRHILNDITSIPDPADLAVLLIPAPFVPDAIEECGQRGIKAVVIASGGFREVGGEGIALEEKCLEVAARYDIRLIGPNCIGLLDTHLPIDTTFLPPPGPQPGHVAFVSHSGAICAAVIDWARGQGFGLSRLVSLGNQADITETDVLASVADDKYTRVLTMYLEGLSDGRRFVEEASKVSLEKPIIALKVGRFESGQKAVASHTGALAGAEHAFNAAFRRACVIRAESSEEMFDWARALAWCPLPKGPNVAVLTNAGGPGVTAADALEALGLNMASLQLETTQRLEAILPPAASLGNPVDMLASASPDQYANSLQILLDDPGVDSVLVILPPPPMYTSAGVANAMIPIIQTSDKPVVLALMGERLIQEAVERLRSARIPEYRFPERAASALHVLWQRENSICDKHDKQINAGKVDAKLVKTLLSKAQPGNDGFLSQETVAQIMDAYNIPILSMQLARNAEEAVEIAQKIGFPVVLKLASPDVAHKSDVGGVLVDLSSKSEVEKGFFEILQNVQDARPGAKFMGGHVQRMIPQGQEVIVGAVQDPQFGALVMFGSGGVDVEGLGDVAFALAPIIEDDAEYLINSTWAGKKLTGFRSHAPADKEAVIDVLARLGQLAADFPELAEIEINPLRVMPEGQGVYAVDVRVRMAQ
ncbi:MAG: CoA-binding protein [Chloroflexi bacterium]|nr:CoA-binding protein [Chloroflexota bacterium]